MPAPSPVFRFGRSVALFWDFVGTILASAFIGWLIDRQVDTEPYGMLVLLLIGVAGGFIRLVRELRRLERLDHDG